MKNKIAGSPALLTGIVLGIIVFVIDAYLPFGKPPVLMYLVLLIIMFWKHASIKTLYSLAALYSCLTFLKFIVSPPGDIPSNAYFNRSLFVIVMSIITYIQIQRKREAKKSREELENIARFPGENPNPVIRISADGNLLYANPASKSVLPGSVSAAGLSVPPGWLSIVSRAVSENRHIEVEYDFNERTFLMLYVPIPGKNYVNIYGSDITDRKLAQLKIEESLAELSRSNRELEQFAYVASHDLQEPVRMVSNFMKLLSQKYEDKLDDNAKTYIEFAVDGAKRMNVLIHDLLTYSRLTTKAGKLEPCDLNIVVQNVLKDIQMVLEESKAVIKVDPLPTVQADEVQMGQLFQNLIVNAVKFKKDIAPEIFIKCQPGKYEWLFCVEDNGIGIDPQYFERIFIIFQRLHEREKYPGTGIGLSVCRKIVERHGGLIWVESEAGKGSKFYFTLRSAAD